MSADEKNILYRANITSAPIWILAMTLAFFVFDLAGHGAAWIGWLVACFVFAGLRMGASWYGLRRKSDFVHRLMLFSLIGGGLLFTLPIVLVHPLSDPQTMLLIAMVLSIATSGAHTLALSRIGMFAWIVPGLVAFIWRMATMPEAIYPDYTTELRLAIIIGCILYAGLLTALGIGSAKRIRRTFELQHSLQQANRENRRRASEAEAATNAKSEFLAMMSHEIRTPLNGVLGMAQALDREELKETQREKVKTIIDSGTSLMRILNDILDISKIEAGKMEISTDSHDLHQTLASVHSLFLPAARERKVDLRLEFDDTLPRHAGFDAMRVRQCISNLVSNAVKFTREGEVVIAASATPMEPDPERDDAPEGRMMVSIRISDTGIGMSETVRERLFSTFSQADASTTRNFGGTGLGLAISRRLARMMGGDICVESELGKGSVFTMTFTAQAEADRQDDETGQPAEITPSDGNGQRVLVVDDIAVNRQVVRVFLEPAGYSVTEASNGAAALECLASDSFDIVLLDIHMPVMDGYETIRRIRAGTADWAGIPVIALTADAMAGDREKLLATGMNAYVSKPIDRRDLLRQIARFHTKALSERREAIGSR